MNVSLDEFTKHLKEACTAANAQFCIVYHDNPDGDCIGSAYALALILRVLGAKTAVRGCMPVPEQFLCLTESITNDAIDESAIYIAVDCKDRERTGTEFEEKSYMFWIDHHGDDKPQAEFEFVDRERSACSELILDIADALEVPVTKQMADLLYAALVTDTNCFRASAANTGSFTSAARMAELGADIRRIGRKYAFVKSTQRIKLEQLAFGKMHAFCGGRFVTTLITLADLAACGIEDQNAPALHKFNEILMEVEGADLTIVIREYPDHTRFSVKTTADAPITAQSVANHFEGDGHPDASGGKSPKKPDILLKEMEDYCLSQFT